MFVPVDVIKRQTCLAEALKLGPDLGDGLTPQLGREEESRAEPHGIVEESPVGSDETWDLIGRKYGPTIK